MICINPEIIDVAPAIKMDLGRQVERSSFKPQGTYLRSSGALRAASKQQGRAELWHKALLHSWDLALGPAILHTVCFYRRPHTLLLQLAESWEGQEQASTVPGHRLGTETPALTFILWSSTSSTLATRMKEGVLLSTASSFMLTRKPWGGRWGQEEPRSVGSRAVLRAPASLSSFPCSMCSSRPAPSPGLSR